MNTRHILSSLLLLVMSTQSLACLVYADDEYVEEEVIVEEEVVVTTDRRGRDVVIEEEVIVEEEVVVEEEVIVEEEEAYVPLFAPVMASNSVELVEQDLSQDTSSQLFTINLSDIADDEACTIDMDQESFGSVVTMSLYGFETPNEFAACPVGRYDVVPECDLYQGEACMGIILRDTLAEVQGQEFAVSGYIDISIEYGQTASEPNRCIISTYVDRSEDMTFEFDMFFDDYELSPTDDNANAICTL